MQQANRGLHNFNEQAYEASIAQSNVRSVISMTSHETLLRQFRQYEPKSNIIQIEQLRSSSHLKVKKFKESAYYGEIINGKRHGQGIMLYNNDRIYQGHWENDYKHGRGFQMFPNSSVYQGEYLNGKPEGIGKYQWPNGEFYQGQWLNGLKHGSGMWQGAKSDSYVGEWRMGKAEGYGVHVWINGDRYEGDFKNCLKQGQGTEKFANGDLYKGQYFRGKPNGYGEYYWANSSYFKGNFKEGLRDGHGMWKKGSGTSDKYEGEYQGDKKHGYGIFSWASGNVYKGNYEDDLRCGYGEMYWGDGSYYKGQWLKGIQHGQGLLFVPGQGVKKGKFKDNVLVEILEEEVPITPPQTHQNHPQPSIPYIPRPGSIHKNSQIPPLEQQRLSSNYRGADKKRKVLSVHQHPQNNNNNYNRSNYRISKDVNPVLKRGEKRTNKTTNVAQIQRYASGTANARSRERIPHSAFYMHKLHKRVSTANNEEKPSMKNKAEIVDELRSFTKKMVGRRPK